MSSPFSNKLIIIICLWAQPAEWKRHEWKTSKPKLFSFSLFLVHCRQFCLVHFRNGVMLSNRIVRNFRFRLFHFHFHFGGRAKRRKSSRRKSEDFFRFFNKHNHWCLLVGLNALKFLCLWRQRCEGETKTSTGENKCISLMAKTMKRLHEWMATMIEVSPASQTKYFLPRFGNIFLFFIRL